MSLDHSSCPADVGAVDHDALWGVVGVDLTAFLSILIGRDHPARLLLARNVC
jgi:hypothetical protein